MRRTAPFLALCLLASCSSPPTKQEAAPRLGPTPDVYRVRFETSKGNFTVEVRKDWAPHAADRFYELVERRFYDGARFFRVIRNFIAQWGIAGDPAVHRQYASSIIPDDPPNNQTNARGTVVFAQSGPNTRTTQVFINLRDNPSLDKQGFAPFGRIVEGDNVPDRFYSGYGEPKPEGMGPSQAGIQREGNDLLDREYPRLDSIRRARVVR